MPYLTTDAAAADKICRRFAIPSNLISNFMGALYQLANESNWEQFGALTPEEQAYLYLTIVSESEDGCMVGTVFPYITQDPPTGSLALDGSTYNDADYPTLAAAIDPTWSNGDGTFTLPDTQGRTIIGAGAGAGLSARAMGDTLGSETITLVESEIPSHVHSDTTTGVTAADPIAGVPAPAASVATPSTTGATGGGGAHGNMQPSIALPLAVWAV